LSARAARRQRDSAAARARSPRRERPLITSHQFRPQRNASIPLLRSLGSAGPATLQPSLVVARLNLSALIKASHTLQTWTSTILFYHPIARPFVLEIGLRGAHLIEFTQFLKEENELAHGNRSAGSQPTGLGHIAPRRPLPLWLKCNYLAQNAWLSCLIGALR
jgi:hypothetical protein